MFDTSPLFYSEYSYEDKVKDINKLKNFLNIYCNNSNPRHYNIQEYFVHKENDMNVLNSKSFDLYNIKLDLDDDRVNIYDCEDKIYECKNSVAMEFLVDCMVYPIVFDKRKRHIMLTFLHGHIRIVY